MQKHIWLVLVMFVFTLQAQQFKGLIKDKKTQTVLPGVAVICKEKKIGYKFAFTNNKGEFKIAIPKPVDSLYVEVKLLGYKTYRQKIKFNKNTFKTIFLEESQEQLKEVVIESTRKIIVNKDTVRYNLSSFIDKTEASVEDVLKKLPGVEVDETGIIRVGGKEIEKILIEGDDLTARDYKLLSKNLDANLLKSVEVLRNYDENPIKKQIQHSEKVALNLLIKDNKKNVLFGVLKGGLATRDNYDISATLGLLNKKFKILNLNMLNTVGEKLIENKNLSFNNDFDLDKNNELGLFKEANGVVDNNLRYFKKNETVLNNSKTTSLTFNKKLKKGLKLRFLGKLQQDKVDINDQTQITFITNDINTINENTTSFNNEKKYAADAQLTYFKNNTYLTYFAEIANLKNNLEEALLFNVNNNEVSLYNTNRFHKHHIKLTNKIGEYGLLRNYTYYQQQKSNENYTTKNGGFNGSEFENLMQEIQVKTKNYGFKTEFLHQASAHGFSLNTVVDRVVELFENDILESSNSLYNYKNEATQFNFKIRANYFFQKKGRKKIGLKLHHNTNVIEDNSTYKKFNLLGYGVNYYVYNNAIGNFTIGYNYKPTLLNASNFYKGNVLKNYRTYNQYTSNVEKVDNSSITIGHNFQRFNKGFISFTNLSYSMFSKAVLVNSKYTNGYVNNEYGFTDEEGSLLFFQNQTSKYFSSIKSSLKIDNSFTKLISFYALDNVISRNTNYGYTGKLSGTTYFKSKVNFEFLFQLDKSWNQVENLTTTNDNFLTRVKAKYKIKQGLIFTVDWNNHWLANNYYKLMHANLIYKPKKSRFDYKFIAHNIFNNNTINSIALNEFNTITNKVSIIPNYYMISVNYRF